jgi:hypothetical protein
MGRLSLTGLLAIVLLVTGITFGQTTSGDLSGTVVDATGALIANPSVVVTNVETGVSSTTKGTAGGEVRISNLPPGTYNFTATAPGFASYTIKNLRIDLNKTSTATFTLSPSSATESVDVSAEAAVTLDTTSTNLTQTFETRELSTLPSTSTGQGVLNVSLLSPNVASTGGIGIGVGPSVGGQRPRNNNFMIEGVDNNDKAVTGPLLYVPNDAVGEFSLITNQFSPEFGHSSGGQFNTNIISGTNKFHGVLYEYFQNRNLNAENAPAGQKVPNPPFDDNRYGGQIGGPILKDKLFFFANYEREVNIQQVQAFVCVPTTAGLAQLNAQAAALNLNANNLAQYAKYTPAVATQANAATDVACFNQASGPQTAAIYSDTNSAGVTPYPDNSSLGTVFGSTGRVDIPLGNYHVLAPASNVKYALTTSGDWTISQHDSLRLRYLYNSNPQTDVNATLPEFYQSSPFKFHLVALSEFHTFTPNLTNEVRLGYHRYQTATPSGPFSYPGLDSFPNLTIFDQNGLNYGPDSNAPQSTIENEYQFTDNILWTKGKHTFAFGFDGRKAISPQEFTQRQRGDYEWDYLTEFLHDLAPTSFGQRSTGNATYYGDQTSFYGYANDTWRATPKLTINYGLRYEFTSVPVGEREQQLNVAASVPGLVQFTAPQPQYKNFVPRFGINFAPDQKTSIRAAFGMAQDVLFDNLGTLSFPPQLSATNSVGAVGNPNFGDPSFLADGGLPPGAGGVTVFPSTPAGLVAQRAATAAYLPNQVLPYAETWSLGVQRVIGANYTAEVRYVGTRGIHLATQDQINIQPRVNAANQLPTNLTGPTSVATGPNVSTLGNIQALSNLVPAWGNAGFTSTITSYQPFSQSNYNALSASLVRRFQHGFLLNAAYTWSKTMDDATAEVFSTVLTPRRPQNSQNVGADYSRSALDRTNRLTIAAVYDLPYFKQSNWLMKNIVGNWEVSPIYTYESPEYATALSGVNSNQNGDSSTIDRPIVNPNGVKGTGSGVSGVYSTTIACPIPEGATVAPAQCPTNLVGYVANNPNAYYIAAGAGTLPNAARNTLPIRPIDNIDLALVKRINITERIGFEFQAQAFNVLNHAQYLPGSLNGVQTDLTASTLPTSFQTVGNPAFNQPEKIFKANARGMLLAGKLTF